MAWTNTSTIPDEEVVRAIRAVAKEIDLDRTVIHVKHYGFNRWSYGMAYPSIPSIANMDGLDPWDWHYLITVTDASFVSTLAHEAKHVEQFKRGIRPSEPPCNAFGAWFEELYSRTTPEGAAGTSTGIAV